MRGIRILGMWALAMLLVLAAAWCLAIWQANRDIEPVSVAERQASFRRAVDWLKANESGVLMDANSALWWMVKTAAERSQDEYLLSLVNEAARRHYPPDRPIPVWKRMIDPHAEVAPVDMISIDRLEAYQRFFMHGLSCTPIPLDDGGDTSRFLRENICRPLLFKVWPDDPVCSTHQAMGLALFKRTGCAVPVQYEQISKEVLADIAFQVRYDILMRDAYLQHVLMLMWQGGPDAVKPIWLHRVLKEQQADGGWRGHKIYPFLPDTLQPWHIHRLLQAWWPSRFPTLTDPPDLHASAQGLLLMALSLPAQPRQPNGLAAN